MAAEKSGRDFLTVKELAAYLRLSETSVYRMIRRSEIPVFKVGGDWRFSRNAIEQWLRSAHSPARDVSRVPDDLGALQPEGASVIARLHQTISAMIGPLAELQVAQDKLKRIARNLDDRCDTTADIASLYEGRTISPAIASPNLLATAPFPYSVVDSDLRLVDYNEAYCRILKYSPQQLRSYPSQDLIVEGDRENVRAVCARMISGESQAIEFACRAEAADGELVVLRSNGWAVYAANSRKVEYVPAIFSPIASPQQASELFARTADMLAKYRNDILSRS